MGKIYYDYEHACEHCTEYKHCGWCRNYPTTNIPVEHLTHGACERFCEPSNFTADDIDDDTAIDILTAIVERARLDEDTKFLEKIRRYAYDSKRVVKSWL